MKRTLTIIVFISLFLNSYGQRTLKKREVLKKLDEIENEINNKNYEKALNIFQSKSEIILEENVGENHLERFKNISSVLSEKEELMKINKSTVEFYKNYYDDERLCDATLLLSVELSKENSFIETQNIFEELKSKLLEIKPLCEENENKVSSCQQDYDNNKCCDAVRCIDLKLNPQSSYVTTITTFVKLFPLLQKAKSKCSDYSDKIKKWQMQYVNNEFEKLIPTVLKLDNYEQGFIPSSDKETFEELKKRLEERKLSIQKKEVEKAKALQAFKEIYVYPLQDKIKEIRLEKLTYLKARDYIELLTALSKKLDNAKININEYSGFTTEIKNLKTEVHNVLYDLKVFAEENKPQYIDLVQLYNDFAGEGMFGESKYTDIQRDHFWNNDYKGKAIIGNGTVYEVAERIFRVGTYITIQVSTSHYVDLYLDGSEEKKLLGIYKGQTVKFIGELDDVGTGIMLHHSIKNVKILEVY